MERFRVSLHTIQLSEQEGKAPPDVQILRTGTFSDPRYGTLSITPEMLRLMCENHQANVRGIDISIDYKHEAEDIAAAWFKSVYLSKDGTELWAKVEWTPRGRGVVEEKEFRYLSAEFTTNYQDNESLKKFGPTLLGAGLTNRPVIKGMKPVIELSELTNEGKDKMNELEKLKDENKKLSEQVSGLEAEKKKLMDGMNGMTPEQMMAKIGELEATIAKMKSDAEMAEKKAAEQKMLAEKRAQFDALLSEGKAVEAQREPFMAGDMIKFAELTQKVNLKAAGTGGTGEGDGKDVVDQVMELAEKKVADREATDIGAAVSIVLSENTELRKKYEDATK
jgi:phage I-like protein